ncbi:MAG TPA: hypothetical protein VGM92_09505, partial [Candidatus Kapabacteria bacterium]
MFSLFLPERCVHCQKATAFARHRTTKQGLAHYLCDVCLRIIEHHEKPVEERVRDAFGKLGSHIELTHTRAGFPFMAASPVQSVVHSFKYQGMAKLAQVLGRSLAALVPATIDVIVPVPLHRTRLAERGYNQAEVLANAMGSNAEVIRAVKRRRPTPSQTNLSLPKRIENMEGAFALT